MAGSLGKPRRNLQKAFCVAAVASLGLLVAAPSAAAKKHPKKPAAVPVKLHPTTPSFAKFIHHFAGERAKATVTNHFKVRPAVSRSTKLFAEPEGDLVGSGDERFPEAQVKASAKVIASKVNRTKQADRASVSVTFNPKGVKPGRYIGSIRVTGSRIDDRVPIEVTLRAGTWPALAWLVVGALAGFAVALGFSGLDSRRGVLMAHMVLALIGAGGAFWAQFLNNTTWGSSSDDSWKLVIAGYLGVSGAMTLAGVPAASTYVRNTVPKQARAIKQRLAHKGAA